MKKEEQDKVKKLLEDIINVSDKIDNLKSLGETKEISKMGNSAHILMGKKFIGRKALVIVLPEVK